MSGRPNVEVVEDEEGDWRSRVAAQTDDGGAEASVDRVIADLEQEAAEQAAALLKQVGVNRGLCVAVGQELEVVLELVQSSDLLVLVREPNAKARARLQQAADEAGLGIDRLVIQAGDATQLPYADRLIDAVITATPKLGDKEAMRVLRPEGALIRTDGKQLATGGGDGAAVFDFGCCDPLPENDRRIATETVGNGAGVGTIGGDAEGAWRGLSQAAGHSSPPPAEGSRRLEPLGARSRQQSGVH